jgi:hypothetical protein
LPSIRSDPHRQFIDHDARRSLLGKAATGLLMAFADTGDGMTLEEAIDMAASHREGGRNGDRPIAIPRQTRRS